MKRSPLKACRKKPVEQMLDKMWQWVVKSRAGCDCEVRDPAGCMAGAQAAHIVTRRDKWLRWNPKNGVCACPNCHDDRKIKAWLKRTDPQRYEWAMRERARTHPGLKLDLEVVYDDLAGQM